MAPVRAPCVFCERIRIGPLLLQNGHAVAFPDGFPVTLGHTLVVARRCVACFFDLTEEEQGDLLRLVIEVRGLVEREGAPDGWNIGLNVGAAAGQTVAHAHIHMIPRRHGDVPDPRGGVRCVIPSMARYWEMQGDV